MAELVNGGAHHARDEQNFGARPSHQTAKSPPAKGEQKTEGHNNANGKEQLMEKMDKQLHRAPPLQ